MEAELGRTADSLEAHPVTTDEVIWADVDPSEPDETAPPISNQTAPRIPDDVPQADALDQARVVPLDDDR